MKIIALLLLLSACSPLKHYQKVADDAFRNSAERALLARACTQEFPAIQDSARVIFSGVDSSDYIELAQYTNSLIDSLIKKGQDTILPGVVYKCSAYDSARIVKSVWASIKPATIVKTEIKEIKVRDQARELLLQNQVDQCRNENEGLVIQAKASKDAQKRTGSTNIWLYIVCGLLFAGNAYQLFAKKGIV